jgi:signal peptidase I
MVFDFSFILAAAALVTGVVWAIDSWIFLPRRRLAPQDSPAAREPILVEYARSFFPIIVLVLAVRSFLFEPFRIPSDSMMPTLLSGDFIFVNKYTYGLRLPVLNTKVIPIGEPKRGDVIVFRLPSDPSTNYIKRLVGLPGDHIRVTDKFLYINEVKVPVLLDGIYEGHGHTGARIGQEQLGDVNHRILFLPERSTADYENTVPEGHYFFMGDNRDNSRDSRYPEVGFVPEENLVGKAVRIWLSWNIPNAPDWSRMGSAIH